MANSLPAVLLLEGPNLNMLGRREASIYGKKTAAEVHAALREACAGRCEFEAFQSNDEAALIERIHGTAGDDGRADGLVVNAASLTHTSIGIRDALLAVGKPFVEVHLSNVFAREPFRHHSYLSDIAAGVIVGLGPKGYHLAIDALLDLNPASDG